jgi:hypothetical protein
MQYNFSKNHLLPAEEKKIFHSKPSEVHFAEHLVDSFREHVILLFTGKKYDRLAIAK